MITQTNLNSIYETSVRITEEPSCLLSKKLLKKKPKLFVYLGAKRLEIPNRAIIAKYLSSNRG